MQAVNYAKLKSGTDVRGVAVGDRSPVTLTDEAVEAIVKAFAKRLSATTGKTRLKIAVGNDSRISAERVKKVGLRLRRFDNDNGFAFALRQKRA